MDKLGANKLITAVMLIFGVFVSLAGMFAHFTTLHSNGLLDKYYLQFGY